MSFEILFTLIVLAVTVVLFASGRLRVDLVALLILVALLLGGVISPSAALSGFSNPAVVTVAALLVLSAGLLRTGFGRIAAEALGGLAGRRPWMGLLGMMAFVGGISAFINNTAAVAILLPVILEMARRIQTSPSKLLMPLSFASMFGGVCTLIGTSTNLLASEIARAEGARPFGMFEFAPLGLIFFATGTVYMLTVGVRMIPARRKPEGLTASFKLAEYLTEITLQPESPSVGLALAVSPLGLQDDLDVIEIRRGRRRIELPSPEMVLREGDVCLVRATLPAIRELEKRADVTLEPRRPFDDAQLEGEEAQLLEVVIVPGSSLAGSTPGRSRIRNTYGATVLAIRHYGALLHESLRDKTLAPGDTLLLEVPRDRMTQLANSADFVLVSGAKSIEFRREKLLIAAAILVGVVGLAAAGIVPMVVAALAGCVAMLLTGVIDLEDAYRAVDWKIVFLLAGVLGLGRALNDTGAAAMISESLLGATASLGPIFVLSGLYLLTSLLTEAMSNNATVVLLAPIAIGIADVLGVDSRPFLMAVTFAASASFMTPIGYQTNTLIFGPGGYKFTDFVKVGLPLNVLFWILATVMIPVIWPF